MQNIALAKKIEFKPGKDQNEGSIIVEPLYPGYGMTLGNSLRRVLLSLSSVVVGVKKSKELVMNLWLFQKSRKMF